MIKARAGQSKLANILLAASLAMPILVAFAGLRRAYDAVPDQDLLWISEALRLYRNSPPAYIDHPGAYWTLSFLAKLKLLSFRGLLNLIQVRPGEAIGIGDSNILIQLSRVEQGLICSLIGLNLYLLMKRLGVSQLCSSLGAFIYTTSPGLLWEVVLIRNESTSLMFLLIFTNICIRLRAISQRSRALAITAAVLAIVSFLFSIYCKIQVVILSTFALILVVIFLFFETGSADEKNDQICFAFPALKKCAFAAWTLFVAGFSWIILTSNWNYAPATPYYSENSLLNILFWSATNCLLALAPFLSISFRRERSYTDLLSWLGVVVFIEVLMARIVFHASWSNQVFSVPSSLFSFSAVTPQSNGFGAISFYLNDLFAWPPVVSAVLMISCLALLIATFFLRRTRLSFFIMLCGVACMIVFVSMLARLQIFYATYFMAPFIMLIAYTVSATPIPPASRRAPRYWFGARTLPLLLMIGMLIRSLELPATYQKYATFSNTSEQLCYAQQMDSLMRHTSVGSCSNFERDKKP